MENYILRKYENTDYEDEGIKRKKFVSRGSGKIEDEYITSLLKEEWIR